MKMAVNLYQFTDYRTYLVAYAQDMKHKRKQWSYGAWARVLGLKSTSSITKIVQGQREPGEEITERLIKYFEFSDKQARYFRDLIQLEKINRDPKLSVLLIEKMGKEYSDSSIRIMDNKSFMTISHWYYLALRELCRTKTFKEDPEWISSRFLYRVTPRDIRQAIQVLLDVGLLAREKNGKLYLAEGRIDTTTDISSEAIKRYHEQMLEHAKIAVRETPVEEREITSTTLVMSSKNIGMAKELIREFRQNFERLLEEDTGDRVFQIQIQLFPLTVKENHKEYKK